MLWRQLPVPRGSPAPAARGNPCGHAHLPRKPAPHSLSSMGNDSATVSLLVLDTPDSLSCPAVSFSERFRASLSPLLSQSLGLFFDSVFMVPRINAKNYLFLNKIYSSNYKTHSFNTGQRKERRQVCWKWKGINLHNINSMFWTYFPCIYLLIYLLLETGSCCVALVGLKLTM